MLHLALLLACSSAPPPADDDGPPPTPTPTPTAATAPGAPHREPGVDFDDPDSCAACHGAVVAEWKTSMHAHAHHDRDPIYGGMRELRMQKQGAEVGATCPVCHNPRAPSEPDSPAGLQGVSCAACHAAAAIDRDAGSGAKALTYDPYVLRGARDLSPDTSPVHGTGAAAPHLADGQTMCLVCHDATQSPGGAPSCTTGPELADADRPDDAPTCTTCHMPPVDGPSGAVSKRSQHASHAFLGPHQAWAGDDSFLASSVHLDLKVDGDVATLRAENRSGHAFPTGFPGRMALLVVEALDAQGEVVWTNAEDSEARLIKIYVDADGKQVAAPFSTELKHDGRLTPGEVRTLSYPLPQQAASARAAVVYRLLPPPLAETLGLADDPLASPRRFGEVTATR